MAVRNPPRLRAIRLLIHGFELPSFATPDLRAQLAVAMRAVMLKAFPDELQACYVDFDEQRPRYTGEAITLEVNVTGEQGEEGQMEYAQKCRPEIARLAYWTIQQYVEADAKNLYEQRHAPFLYRV